MIAFPSMLIGPAEKAGIPVPPDPDNYSKEEFKRFFIFEMCQLGASMPYPSCVWDNAQVIAQIPEDKLEIITHKELVELGFRVGASNELA